MNGRKLAALGGVLIALVVLAAPLDAHAGWVRRAGHATGNFFRASGRVLRAGGHAVRDQAHEEREASHRRHRRR